MQYKLYNGEVLLEFDEDKHVYTLDGEQVDGVTGILSIIAKPALLYWAVNQSINYLERNIRPGVSYDEIQLKKLLYEAKGAHRMKSTEASDIGKIVHKWIEEWIAGKDPKMPINEEARRAITQFQSWVLDKNVKFLQSEKVIYSRKFNYAGTTDFIAQMNGKTILGDFKTSNGIWDEYWFQVAAYQHAFLEEFPDEEIHGNMIVRLGKDGTLEIKENYDYDKNIVAFLGAVALYRRVNELKPPYVPKYKKY